MSRDKPCLWSCWHMLKLNERSSYFELLEQTKPGSITLNCRQKGNPWNGTIPKLHRRKNSLCQQTRLQPLLTGTVKELSLWMKWQEWRKLSVTISRYWKNSQKDSNESASGNSHYGIIILQWPQDFKWQEKNTKTKQNPHTCICCWSPDF